MTKNKETLSFPVKKDQISTSSSSSSFVPTSSGISATVTSSASLVASDAGSAANYRPSPLSTNNNSIFTNHSLDMTPVSPKSPPLEGASHAAVLHRDAAAAAHVSTSSQSSSKLSIDSLFWALKDKLAHGLVKDHVQVARNTFFTNDPQSKNDDDAADCISTLHCMELCSLLMPLLKRDILVRNCLAPSSYIFLLLITRYLLLLL